MLSLRRVTVLECSAGGLSAGCGQGQGEGQHRARREQLRQSLPGPAESLHEGRVDLRRPRDPAPPSERAAQHRQPRHELAHLGRVRHLRHRHRQPQHVCARRYAEFRCASLQNQPSCRLRDEAE